MMAMIGSGWEIYNASPLFPFARPNELWVALCPEHRSLCDVIEHRLMMDVQAPRPHT
jgi:thiosulfate reductase cytochrome b subunit